jgi:hypothetical protein
VILEVFNRLVHRFLCALAGLFLFFIQNLLYKWHDP